VADLTLKFQGEQVDVVKNINLIIDKLDNLEKKLDGAAGAGSRAGKKLSDTFMGVSRRIGRAVTRIGGLLGGVGLTGIIYKAVRATSDFETAMAEVSTLITGDVSKKMDYFNGQVRELATESNATAGQLSKGLYQVLSAGTKGTEDAAQAMDLLTIANKSAVAGVTDTFSSVDVLTTILNAYEKSAADATDVSDALFTTVKLGKVTYGELASQLGKVVSITAGAGVAFDEVAAAMAAMTKAGLQSDLASTALRATMIAFLNPSKQLKKLMTDLGYESAAAALKQEGLLGVMKILKKETGGNSEQLQKLIPNVRALAGVAIMAGTGFDNFANAVGEMGVKTGATEEAFKKMSDTFSFKMQKFKNVMTETLMKLGNKIMPVLTKKMEEFGKWVSSNGEEIADTFKSAFEAVVGAGEWIIKNSGTIATAISAIFVVGPIMKFVEWVDMARLKLLGILSIVTSIGALTKGGVGGAVARMGEEEIRRRNEELAAQIGPALSKTEGGATAWQYTGGVAAQTKKLEEENKKATAKQVKEWRKQREAAQKYLFNLETAAAEKGQALRMRFERDIAKIREMRGMTDEERERAIQARTMVYLERRGKLLEKQAKGREDAEKKIAETRRKADEAMKAAVAEANRIRAAQDAFAARGIGGFLGKIGGAELETESERRAYKFAEAEAKALQDKMAEPTWWDRIAIGFKEAIGKKLLDVAMSAGEALLWPFQQMFGFVMTALQSGDMGAVHGAVDQATSLVTNIAENLGPILDYLLNEGLPKFIDAVVNALPQVIQALAEYVPDIVGKIVDSVPRIVNAVIGKLPEIIGAAVELVPQVVTSFIKAIPQIVGAFVAEIPYIAAAFAKAVVEAVLNLLTLGAFGKKKGGSTPGIGKGKGTEEQPAVVSQTEELEEKYPGVDPTHAAALGAAEMERRMRGESREDARERRRQERAESLRPWGFKHLGGMVERASSFAGKIAGGIRAHSGLMVPKLGMDEVPIIAQAGEAILNRAAVATVGGAGGVAAINAGQMPVNNFYLSPQYLYAKDADEVMDDMLARRMGDKIGKTYKKTRGGTVGFRKRRKG